MKRLTRMKLINWHRFTNTIIEFDDSTLISGENGAGKSTLLDAIQFVITCSTNYFNKAAHENGKRKLTGYIRCKTGRENKPYERTGEISAHVALEFYEEKKQQYFIVGVVIDSASEGQEKWARYMMDKVTLDDEMFFSGTTPKSITQFRTTNSKKIKNWCTTDKDAKVMIRNRFGRIEEKFFRLIPKAMAFRPIDDIKDFVYSYVLDEKEVNIDILRENVRSYQDLQRTLDLVKIRIGRLETVERYHAQALDGKRKDKMYEYYLERAQADIIQEKIQGLKEKIKAEEFRLSDQQRQIANVTKEKNEKQDIRDNLRTELASDKDFIAVEEQKKQLARLKEKKQDLEPERQRLFDSVRNAKKNLRDMSSLMEQNSDLKKYQDALRTLEHATEFAEFKEILHTVISYKNEKFETMQMDQAKLQVEEKKVNTELKEWNEKIEKLNKKKFSYPTEVDLVLQAIREEFHRIGRQPEPRVLCEMLEITDESWRNAVEGYLNTQRFYILVEPENFDIALGTYDRLRKERKAYGVGLINTQKLEEYEKAPEGSLATVVTSKNKYAGRYINMILGKVHMCNHYNELKNYPTSITRECMKYQNHVANAIKPRIFETPFIGSNAIKVQLEQAKQRKAQLKELLQKLEEQIKELEHIKKSLDTTYDIDIQYRVDILPDMQSLAEEIDKCNKNIATLEKNSNMLQKQIQLSTLEDMIRELEQQLLKNNQCVGRIEEKIQNANAEILEHSAELVKKKAGYVEQLANAGDDGTAWEKEYDKQTSDKSFVQFYDNYTRRKKANLTIIDRAVTDMEKSMVEYKTAHDFGAAPTMEGYPDFAAEYDKLRNSELLNYEEKVQSARNAAEEEFREQFLSKLQENMKIAQAEFKELNKALNDIMFSNEKYEFLFMPSKRYRHYYEMIMDDFNAMQGESIFSGLFHENHKEVIDELFEKLALDNENNAKALDEFTDYRTYMDYDIKIIHSDGNYSFYSKVCEEKSGGETQTPFYVTVAASFVQLYRNSIGGEAIGLVLFDEAFNNMDDERIGGVLEFLRRLPLQIIIAAPPDKIQYISPYIAETLLVMTDEKVSFVERYHNGAI